MCKLTHLEGIGLLYGEMRDIAPLECGFAKAPPDEVYNLAGQITVSRVGAFPRVIGLSASFAPAE